MENQVNSEFTLSINLGNEDEKLEMKNSSASIMHSEEENKLLAMAAANIGVAFVISSVFSIICSSLTTIASDGESLRDWSSALMFLVFGLVCGIVWVIYVISLLVNIYCFLCVFLCVSSGGQWIKCQEMRFFLSIRFGIGRACDYMGSEDAFLNSMARVHDEDKYCG